MMDAFSSLCLEWMERNVSVIRGGALSHQDPLPLPPASVFCERGSVVVTIVGRVEEELVQPHSNSSNFRHESLFSNCELGARDGRGPA